MFFCVRKCPSSIAPAMLLALSDNIESKSGINLHNSYGHACHAFEAFLLCRDLKKHRKNLPEGVPKWSPTEVTGGSKSMAGAMF